MARGVQKSLALLVFEMELPGACAARQHCRRGVDVDARYSGGFVNEPFTRFIAKFPYIFVPAVFTTARLGHVLPFRRLRTEAQSAAPGSAGIGPRIFVRSIQGSEDGGEAAIGPRTFLR